MQCCVNYLDCITNLREQSSQLFGQKHDKDVVWSAVLVSYPVEPYIYKSCQMKMGIHVSSEKPVSLENPKLVWLISVET